MTRTRPAYPRPTRHRPPVPAGASGVFTRADAHAHGWTDSALGHALAVGRLVRVQRGVYARRHDDTPVRADDLVYTDNRVHPNNRVPADGPMRAGSPVLTGSPVLDDTPVRADGPALLSHRQLDAALLRLARASARICGRSVLSHSAALVAHGLPLLGRPDRPCLTVPAGTALRDLAEVHLHRATLPEHHLTVLDGCPTTTIARAVLDVAREHGFLAGVVAADAALHEAAVTRDQLGEVVEFCARWPGRRAARLVVELCDELAESPLESISRVRMRQFGLPEPVAQAELGDEFGRFIARVDFYWPQFGVVGQADGDEKYRRDGSRRGSERRAEAGLSDLGLLVVRWDWHDAFDFAPIARRLCRYFAQGTPASRGRWSVLNSPLVHAARLHP